MNIIPDLMYDREKLRLVVKKWKWLFFIALLLLVISLNKDSNQKIKKDYIAKVNVTGFIDHDSEMVKELTEIEKDEKAKALIVHINSPGGTSFAGEELYLAFKRVAKVKPVVAVLETVAASGGYMVALASDFIVARNMTLTGSIGVIWQSFEAVELANKLGIKFVAYKSNPLKAAPNPTEVATPEAKAAAMETISDSFDVFVKMVMEGRKMTKQQAMKVANGKVYTGKRAKDLNLIDSIGGQEEALNWLESTKKIPANLPIEDIEWRKKQSFIEEFSKLINNTNNMFTHVWNNYVVMAK